MSNTHLHAVPSQRDTGRGGATNARLASGGGRPCFLAVAGQPMQQALKEANSCPELSTNHTCGRDSTTSAAWAGRQGRQVSGWGKGNARAGQGVASHQSLLKSPRL